MDLYQILDVALYGLMFLDFIIKYVKIHHELKKIGKCKRYHKPITSLKKMIYIGLSIVNLAYVAFRIMQITNGHYEFMIPALVLPVICYYIIFDLVFNGIYYSPKGIFVKNTLIRFLEIEKCYRHFNEQTKGYGYTVIYSPNLQGSAELNFFIDNVPSAFELMMRIPVSNEE